MGLGGLRRGLDFILSTKFLESFQQVQNDRDWFVIFKEDPVHHCLYPCYTQLQVMETAQMLTGCRTDDKMSYMLLWRGTTWLLC